MNTYIIKMIKCHEYVLIAVLQFHNVTSGGDIKHIRMKREVLFSFNDRY